MKVQRKGHMRDGVMVRPHMYEMRSVATEVASIPVEPPTLDPLEQDEMQVVSSEGTIKSPTGNIHVSGTSKVHIVEPAAGITVTLADEAEAVVSVKDGNMMAPPMFVVGGKSKLHLEVPPKKQGDSPYADVSVYGESQVSVQGFVRVTSGDDTTVRVHGGVVEASGKSHVVSLGDSRVALSEDATGHVNGGTVVLEGRAQAYVSEADVETHSRSVLYATSCDVAAFESGTVWQEQGGTVEMFDDTNVHVRNNVMVRKDESCRTEPSFYTDDCEPSGQYSLSDMSQWPEQTFSMSEHDDTMLQTKVNE